LSVPETVIKVESLSKQYRYGVIGHGTLYKDLQSRWARFRGREDPNIKITEHIGPGLDGERFWALKDINLEVHKGERVGIIGRNGAGKSTLLKILSRVTTPTKGQVKLKGRIVSLLEVGTGFHPEQTGRENTFLNGAILGMSKAEVRRKLDAIVDFAGIEKFLDTPVKRYSSGMYVRLAFAVAAHLDSEIMLVDEVLAVGDVQFQKKCLGKMKDVAEGGRTVLFVSHNMAAIRSLCQRTILLDKGALLMDSATNEVVAHYLDQNLVEGAVASRADIEQRIEGKIRRGNPFLRLCEIAMLDKSGLRRQLFHSDEDIIVSITFECLQAVQDLFIILDIVDEDAVPILESHNLDDPSAAGGFRRLGQGMFNASCIVPADTLGGKHFFLTVHLVYPKTEHIYVNKILEFEVVFKGYNDAFSDVGDAFIRPQLEWRVSPVEEEWPSRRRGTN